MKKKCFVISLLIILFLITSQFIDCVSIFYQVRGGEIISYLSGFKSNENYSDFSCSYSSSDSNFDIDLISRAISYYKAALRLDEGNSHSNLQLGRIYCYIDDPEEAAKYYNRYLELRPNNPIGYLELGFAYEKLYKACESIPDCKSSFYYRDSMLSAWKQSEVMVNNFFQAGDEKRKVLEFSSAHDWYLRGFLLDRENSLDINQKNDQLMIIEEFATLTFWRPCDWCDNSDGKFAISNGVLEMSDRNNPKERDYFGYRMLQRIPLDDNNNLVLRVQGEQGTLLTLEAVIDDDRVRLISYQPVPISWEILSVPINGDILKEITIFIREPQPLHGNQEYKLNIDWIGISK
jgi:tetratricopeptide (TPR) repeat protein